MARLTASFCAGLSLLILTSSPSVQAQEIAKYDEGPFAGMGYPYIEAALARRGLTTKHVVKCTVFWPTWRSGPLSMRSTKSIFQSLTRHAAPRGRKIYGPMRG
jgi:hypothetical protein